MATILTVHGLDFSVESDGWGRYESDRDAAVANLEAALRAMPAADAARLHALMADEERDWPDEALRLCSDAVWPVVADWHDPDAPQLMLGAV